jgi:hypothetical protein
MFVLDAIVCTDVIDWTQGTQRDVYKIKLVSVAYCVCVWTPIL